MKKWGNEKMETRAELGRQDQRTGSLACKTVVYSRPSAQWTGKARKGICYMAGRYVHGPLNFLGQALSRALSKTKSPESVDSHAL